MNFEEEVAKRQGYSIDKARWEDPAKINERLHNLQNNPIYEVSDEYYKEVLNHYDTKCAKSKAIAADAKNYLPGGVQHNLAFNKPFPVCFNGANGAYLTDIDGNKYVDFLQAGGPTILGSNYPAVREKVIELLNSCGPVTGLLHEAEYMLAKEVNKNMPSVELFRMLGSGTEAVMAALRVSRIITKNKRIIKAGGAYHGWSDQMVYGLKIPGTRQFLESHGIPGKCYALTDEIRPNDLNMLERMLKINKCKGGTAAVIVEPVGPESGTRPIAMDYNQKAMELAHKYGALFIMDEVVTGFRLGLGGAQGFFGIQPDLTVFGKVIAGGYPAAGGLGGRRDIAGCMASGLVSGGKKVHKAYVGGTLAANPLSSLAGYYTIKEIEKTDACAKAGVAGDYLAEGLQRLCDKYQLPFVVYNQGSIVHLECTGAMSYDYSSMSVVKSLMGILKNQDMIYERKDSMERMGAAYMANGIVTLAGSRLYTSMADYENNCAVIDEALAKFDNVFSHVVRTEKGLGKKK